MTAAGLLALLLSTQTIDTVVIRNGNIFDPVLDGPGFIGRAANALHIRTRPSIIRRTLLITEGHVYDSAQVAESERALRALGVFRAVRVDTVTIRGALALRVVTADGWSSKPVASYSSAGGDETWEVGFVEQNFLGTASELSVGYGRNPDRSRLDFQYVNPHFLAPRTFLYLRYADLSDGRRGGWYLGRPFSQTAARRALETYGDAGRERMLTFRDGALLASTQRRLLRVGVAGGIATSATTRDYVRLLFGAEWRREDFAPETTTVFPRSSFFAGRVGVEVRHVRFRVVEHFNSYARREDVDLSQVLRVGAIVGEGVGYEVRGQASAVWRRGHVVLRGEVMGLDSLRARGRITVVSQNLPRQTVVWHLEGGWLRRPKPGAEFDLWMEQRGPRLFGAHAFTGTRMAWVVVEDRILVSDNVGGLMAIGVAPFVDFGGAWYGDQRARLGGDAGVALRIGPTKSIHGQAGELAIGYRFGDGLSRPGWAIALRKGVSF